jgi:hypothetical protein
LLFLAASVLAVSAGGCTAAQKPAGRAALDCPESQGDLTRTGVAPDRRTCTYRTSDGAEVSLQLVATNGDPWGALKTIEASLIGSGIAAAPKGVETAAATVEATQQTADEAAKVAEQARQDAAGGADGADVNINVEGGRVVVDDDEGTTHVNLPGVQIDAGENNAKVRIGGISINADDDQATIRVNRDVRLKGEALSREKRGLRATFVYSGKDLPNGYTYVGYEAGGPKAGPLAVAVVRFKGGDGHEDPAIDSEVRRLVRLNGGV